MSTPRSRAMKPQLKASTSQLQHKPRVPSRLSFSSLPPLPPLPAPAQSDPSKRSPSPNRSGPKVRRPSPRPRNSSSSSRVSIEDALSSVGAFYIGWEQGKRDPAPLCCPVEKAKIKQRFGEAAVGWMTTPAAPLAHSSLPPLPIPTSSVDTFSTYSPSPPSLVAYDSSSSSTSSSMSISPSSYPFDLSTSPDSSLQFTLRNARATSVGRETLALAPPPLATLPSIKVEESSSVDNFELDLTDVMSEHLWSSSGEDALDGGGFFSGSSSGASDSSWAW